MIATILLSCTLLTGAPGPGDPPPLAEDLAAYHAASEKAGRNADAQVKLALWCEAHGLDAERLKHLTLATFIDPMNAAARGLLGLVSQGGKWLRADEAARRAADDPARTAALREYLERRARTPDRAEEQWKLALWCDQNGLKAQAVAHLHRVVALDPRREAAWKRLGFRKQAGRWVDPEAAAAEKLEAEAQARADKFWKPRLEHWREALAGRDRARRAAAEEELGKISDPRAVPMAWAVFVRGGEAQQRIAVRVFDRIDAPGASRALAMLAVFSPSPAIRQESKEILRRRDPRDFAGLLVGLMGEPVKYQVRQVGGPGTPGELLVEGKEANVRRVYTPLPPPTLMPGDQVGADSAGMPVATRILGSYWTPPTNVGRNLPMASAPADPGRIAGMLTTAGVPAGQSKQLGQAVAHNANEGLSRIPQVSPGRDYLVSQQVTESLQIPLGQMILEAQASAVVAQQQLERDVANLQTYNAPIVETNDRVRDVLKEMGGKDLGPDRDSWASWAADLQGYAFSAQRVSVSTPPPTVVEQVPLDYQPQAVPIVSAAVTGQQITMGHSCFGAGTPVRTLQGPRPIEDIQDGDQVLCQDTRTGALKFQPVVEAYHNPPNATYRIGLGEETIVATGIHRLWKAGQGWVMARDLKPGDRLRTLGGVVEVRSVEPDQVQPVFNLRIAGGDDFFVGGQGVLAHDNSMVKPEEHPFDGLPAAGGPGGPSRP
jgi:hypothetical protein